MANIECKACGEDISTAAKACPHCGALWWVTSGDLSAPPEDSPLTVLRDSGLIEAVGAGAAIIGAVVAFLEPANGAILIGIGVVVFLVGRFK